MFFLVFEKKYMFEGGCKLLFKNLTLACLVHVPDFPIQHRPLPMTVKNPTSKKLRTIPEV
jgi:hypothetical protein